MKVIFTLLTILATVMPAMGFYTEFMPLGDGSTMKVEAIGARAVRVRVIPEDAYEDAKPFYLSQFPTYNNSCISWIFDIENETLTFYDDSGRAVLKEAVNGRRIDNAPDGTFNSWRIAQTFDTQADEFQFGTGQFQDGYLNVKGLTRRLTQVNTQIAMPMIISNQGYGILWNNAGLTDFNPASYGIALEPTEDYGATEEVNVTSTAGNTRETRTYKTFTAEIDLASDGEYAFMVDMGQPMARKHYLAIDDKVLTQADNLWLPPTTSAKARLSKGTHKVEVRGTDMDSPSLWMRKVDNTTTFSSPVSQGIDYTVFVGTPDEIIAQMRTLTGQVPLMPAWAFGYIHCRERYVSQLDLLENAAEFKNRNIPIDVIVQDWQWWGKNGWNAMEFDTDAYPDPKSMTDALHRMDLRLMLSVWAKVDKSSTLGKKMNANGYYIPGTDWIDFFNVKAAQAYWDAYRYNLVNLGIDAWWQDATEPENDDLRDRLVNNGTYSGNAVRNAYPIAVNHRVYNGLLEARPDQRPMILTRSAAPGIQRYGVATWSGDVGNDWQTLRRQIAGGLGQMACGLPWWTYDAGGFFRPSDQYDNPEYHERMLRWIQTAVYLPIMRVHGYMSQTEPWRYGEATCQKFVKAIRDRYSLVPYIYSEARRVSNEGYTLMRPLVFDFPDDTEALKQTTQYMFGKNLLVCPVTEPGITDMKVYLPSVPGGWYDLRTNEHHRQPGYVTVNVVDDAIPVFVKAGSVLPWFDADFVSNTAEVIGSDNIRIRTFPGADGEFELYIDDGISNAYKKGDCEVVKMRYVDGVLYGAERFKKNM